MSRHYDKRKAWGKRNDSGLYNKDIDASLTLQWIYTLVSKHNSTELETHTDNTIINIEES